MPLLVLLVLVVGVVVLVAVAFAGRSSGELHVGTTREWRVVQGVLAASVVVGAVAAWVLAGSLALGRGTMLAPAVLGFFVVAGVALSETVVRPARPAGVRTASLAPRRVAGFAQRTLVTAVVAITALHVATLVLTTGTASADDLGRAGRQVAADCGAYGSAAGPYPGSFYSALLGLVLLTTALAAAAALVAVVRRPRGFAPDELGDDVLRRRSTTRVLAAFGGAVAASHAGVAFFTATALLRMDCTAGWMTPVGWLLLASVPAAVVLLGWFVGRVVRRSEQPSAAMQPVAERQPR
ncbi:hypothetical protein [Intrasporangium flavum]|uniref:hypothetical protein n=1 Tax=Intrasporangium flavum TaxID=1428657 RepID=UPI001A96A048|nr:hypothetical protein [Intrasporangium flavum]